MRALIKILVAVLLFGTTVDPVQRPKPTNAEVVDYFGICRSPVSNDVWIANPVDNSLMRFNADGCFISNKHILSVADQTCPELAFGSVVNVDFDITNNSFFVTDRLRKSVFNIIVAPSYISGDSSQNQLIEPIQTAFCLDMKLGRDRIFVIDRTGNKLACFSRPITEVFEGGKWKDKPFCSAISKLEYTIPSGFESNAAEPGTRNGAFSSPTGVCSDLEGFVYVADTGNDRIQKFSVDGEFVETYDGFSKPVSVFLGDKERLLVLERDAKRISVLNTVSGKTETVFSPTDANVTSIFTNPSCITCDMDGDIWVSDAGNESVFKISGLKSEKPGELMFTVPNVLRSRKTPVHELKIELKKYTCKINGSLVRIKPYAQKQNRIPLIPISFFAKTFLKNNSVFMGTIFESDYSIDKDAKCVQIELPWIDFGDGRVYQRRVVDFSLDSDICYLNGLPVKMDCGMTMISGSYFVAMSILEQVFGVKVIVKPAKAKQKTMNDEYTIYFPDPDFVK